MKRFSKGSGVFASILLVIGAAAMAQAPNSAAGSHARTTNSHHGMMGMFHHGRPQSGNMNRQMGHGRMGNDRTGHGWADHGRMSNGRMSNGRMSNGRMSNGRMGNRWTNNGRAASGKNYKAGQFASVMGRVAGLDSRTKTFNVVSGRRTTPVSARTAAITFHGQNANIFRLMGSPEVKVSGRMGAGGIIMANKVDILSPPRARLERSPFTHRAKPPIHRLLPRGHRH